jgi:prevent-host-death family protein
MDLIMAYYIAMKVANIAELKNNLSKFLAFVEKGEVVEIHKRNIPIAQMIPLDFGKGNNHTILGCGKNTVEINGDLTEPLIPEEDWDMLKA